MNIVLLLAVFAPLVGGLGLLCRPAATNQGRNAFVLALCGAVSAGVLALVALCALTGAAPALTLLSVMEGSLTLALRMDGLSLVFAAIVAVLWPITDLYAFEYMQHEGGQNRFFAFFTMTYGVVLGIATAANLFTLYFFYELLTLCTLPLVMHEMNGQALYAGKKYLLYSMGGAALAFLSMMVLGQYAGLEFVAGGALTAAGAAGSELRLGIGFLLGFFGFGVKAAVFPLHGWLPSAGVAPTPVTALLHAVAVVNAGVFAILRLLYYGYGAAFVAGTWVQTVMLAVTAFTILYGSTMALRLQHLKRRLAYSTVSNLSYILFAAALCSGPGLTAALLHMVVHSVLKIALFFCAGALLCRTEEMPGGVREYVFQYTGFARRAPVIFAVFTVASLGLIGVPPFAGFASKWAIAEAAVALGSPAALAGCAALAASAFLTGLYQLGVVIEGYFPPQGFDEGSLAGLTDPGPRMKGALWAVTALAIGLIFCLPGLQNALAALCAGLV